MSNLEEMGKSQGESRPHTCPVCQGRGFVALGFYQHLPGVGIVGGTEPCRTCNGSGVIWGKP